MAYVLAAVGYSTSYIDPYAALRNKSGIVSQDPKESKSDLLLDLSISCFALGLASLVSIADFCLGCSC